MLITYELNEISLKKIVLDNINGQLPNGAVPFEMDDLNFEVMTKANWKAKEWERGNFRLIVKKQI